MINEILRDIRRYLGYLEEKTRLSVTIHDRDSRLRPFMHELAAYNFHNNPYCLFCKSFPALWQRCVEKQTKVLAKCSGGPFFGMCHAGVCEFVYPFFGRRDDSREVSGFISVSGYRPAGDSVPERVKALPDEFGIPRDELYRIYQKGLSDSPPDVSLTDSLIPPLAHMLEGLIFEYSDASEGAIAGLNSNFFYYSLVNYIQRGHNRRLRLSDMARDLNCSESYISHTFAKYSGMSVSRFTNELRVREARLLLETTALTVGDIALTVGYSDANYFSNVFRGICGISPSEYAAKHRIKN